MLHDTTASSSSRAVAVAAHMPRYNVRDVQPRLYATQQHQQHEQHHHHHAATTAACAVVVVRSTRDALVALSLQLPRLLRDESAARQAIAWEQWREALRTLPPSCNYIAATTADDGALPATTTTTSHDEVCRRDVGAHPAYVDAVAYLTTLEALRRCALCADEATTFARDVTTPFARGRRLLCVDWQPLQRLLRRWLHCRRARTQLHARQRRRLHTREAAARAALCSTHTCLSLACCLTHTDTQRDDDDDDAATATATHVHVHRDYYHALLRGCVVDEAMRRGALSLLQLRASAAASYAWLRLCEQATRAACVYGDHDASSRHCRHRAQQQQQQQEDERDTTCAHAPCNVFELCVALEQHVRRRLVAEEQTTWQAVASPAVVRAAWLADVDERTARAAVTAAEATAWQALTWRVFALRVHYTLRDVQAHESAQRQLLQRRDAPQRRCGDAHDVACVVRLQAF